MSPTISILLPELGWVRDVIASNLSLVYVTIILIFRTGISQRVGCQAARHFRERRPPGIKRVAEPKVLRSATRMRSFGLMGVRAKSDDGAGVSRQRDWQARLAGQLPQPVRGLYQSWCAEVQTEIEYSHINEIIQCFYHPTREAA